jgi:hypothetical protein
LGRGSLHSLVTSGATSEGKRLNDLRRFDEMSQESTTRTLEDVDSAVVAVQRNTTTPSSGKDSTSIRLKIVMM